MGQFDCLPGVFELARIQSNKRVLTYEEYTRYLSIWNELSEEDQMDLSEKALKRSRAHVF